MGAAGLVGGSYGRSLLSGWPASVRSLACQISARFLPGNDDCVQHSQRKLADYLGEIKVSAASSKEAIGKLLAMVRQERVATMLA